LFAPHGGFDGTHSLAKHCQQRWKCLRVTRASAMEAVMVMNAFQYLIEALYM